MSEKETFFPRNRYHLDKWVVVPGERSGVIKRMAWREVEDSDNNLFAAQYWNEKGWYVLQKTQQKYDCTTIRKSGPYLDIKALELAMTMMEQLENA